MNWDTAKRIPWEVVLLFGGGISLADAFKHSGLSTAVAEALTGLGGLPAIVLIATIALAVTFLTEVTSNTATSTILMPVLAAFATAAGLAPELVMVPAVLSASCAFMLPVATAPNAIVYGSGRVPIRAMVRAGIGLNLIGAAAITLWRCLDCCALELELGHHGQVIALHERERHRGNHHLELARDVDVVDGVLGRVGREARMGIVAGGVAQEAVQTGEAGIVYLGVQIAEDEERRGLSLSVSHQRATLGPAVGFSWREVGHHHRHRARWRDDRSREDASLLVLALGQTVPRPGTEREPGQQGDAVTRTLFGGGRRFGLRWVGARSHGQRGREAKMGQPTQLGELLGLVPGRPFEPLTANLLDGRDIGFTQDIRDLL